MTTPIRSEESRPPSLSTELVICTRNRPGEVLTCLTSVVRQTRLPDTVRIVDSSDGKATESLVEDFTRDHDLFGRLIYQRAPVGLTIQRNAAIRSTQADIVLFVDDDTILEEKYIEAICHEFELDLDGSVLGVGGVITNMRRHPAVMRMVKRVFLLDSNRPSRVLPSGRISVAVNLASPIEADWLAGGAMAFRREVFEEMSFNEQLPGPSRGEDIEFSYRARQRGRLVVTPQARIAHFPSAENRISTAQHTYDELIERARRVRTRIGHLRMRWYWWSVLGQVTALTVLAPFSSEARLRLRSSVAATAFVLRESCSGYGRSHAQPRSAEALHDN